ncbi:gp53-like domain-containing protein [Escherichia coli]
MAGTNDFKAFATDANANVTSQEEWETLTALKKGFSSGKASSAQVSKALRQPSTMAAVLGQFIANAELDALDDGDVDGLVAKLATAITTNLGLGDISAAGVATGSMGETGYAIFPMMIGGTRKTFIMQWGTLTLLRSGGTVNINLPIAFPTMVMQAYATHDNVMQTARPTVYAIAPTSRTTITATAMSLHADSVGAAVTRGSDSDLCYGRYLAIGY